MLKDKPYIIFFWIFILSLVISATRLLTWEIQTTTSINWFFVFRDTIPYLGGVSLIIAVLFWLLFIFKRPTHPSLNVAQLLILILSYVSLSYFVGVTVRDGNLMMDNVNIINKVVIFYYVFLVSTIVTVLILLVNVVLSIIKPNIGRKDAIVNL